MSTQATFIKWFEIEGIIRHKNTSSDDLITNIISVLTQTEIETLLSFGIRQCFEKLPKTNPIIHKIHQCLTSIDIGDDDDDDDNNDAETDDVNNTNTNIMIPQPSNTISRNLNNNNNNNNNIINYNTIGSIKHDDNSNENQQQGEEYPFRMVMPRLTFDNIFLYPNCNEIKVERVFVNTQRVLNIDNLHFKILEFLRFAVLMKCARINKHWLYQVYDPRSCYHFNSENFVGQWQKTNNILRFKNCKSLKLRVWYKAYNQLFKNLKHFNKVKQLEIEKLPFESNLNIKQFLTTVFSVIETNTANVNSNVSNTIGAAHGLTKLKINGISMNWGFWTFLNSKSIDLSSIRTLICINSEPDEDEALYNIDDDMGTLPHFERSKKQVKQSRKNYLVAKMNDDQDNQDNEKYEVKLRKFLKIAILPQIVEKLVNLNCLHWVSDECAETCFKIMFLRLLLAKNDSANKKNSNMYSNVKNKQEKQEEQEEEMRKTGLQHLMFNVNKNVFANDFDLNIANQLCSKKKQAHLMNNIDINIVQSMEKKLKCETLDSNYCNCTVGSGLDFSKFKPIKSVRIRIDCHDCYLDNCIGAAPSLTDHEIDNIIRLITVDKRYGIGVGVHVEPNKDTDKDKDDVGEVEIVGIDENMVNIVNVANQDRNRWKKGKCNVNDRYTFIAHKLTIDGLLAVNSSTNGGCEGESPIATTVSEILFKLCGRKEYLYNLNVLDLSLISESCLVSIVRCFESIGKINECSSSTQCLINVKAFVQSFQILDIDNGKILFNIISKLDRNNDDLVNIEIKLNENGNFVYDSNCLTWRSGSQEWIDAWNKLFHNLGFTYVCRKITLTWYNFVGNDEYNGIGVYVGKLPYPSVKIRNYTSTRPQNWFE